ncbi:unnamed protein product, partial [Ectocarpus sp. 12 AP-2014]
PVTKYVRLARGRLYPQNTAVFRGRREFVASTRGTPPPGVRQLPIANCQSPSRAILKSTQASKLVPSTTRVASGTDSPDLHIITHHTPSILILITHIHTHMLRLPHDNPHGINSIQKYYV